MKLYYGEPDLPAALNDGHLLPWGGLGTMPTTLGIYVVMVEQNGSLWPSWATLFNDQWVNPYDYDIPFPGEINFWIGPWASLKLDA